MDATIEIKPALLPGGPALSGLMGAAVFVISGSVEKRIIDRWVKRHGSMFTLKLPALGDAVIVCDPKLARSIMTCPQGSLISGRGNALLQFLYGDSSVFLIDGPAHHRLRRLLVPPFRNKDTLNKYSEIIREIANDVLDDLPVCQPVELLHELRHGMLEIILRIVFGVSDEATLAPFRKSMTELLDLSVTPQLGLRLLGKRLGLLKGWKRLDRALAESDALIYAQIEKRRKDPSTAQQDDIVALLLRTRTEEGELLSDQEIRDQLVTMLIAGHETTATTLAWAFERLLRSPNALAALLHEFKQDGDRYAEAVVQETLRLRPPIPFFSREVAGDFELDGQLIPKGTLLVVHTGYIHQSEDLFPNAQEFNPERFLKASEGPSAWMPFGGGLHSCIGNKFAALEVKIFLKEMLSRGEFVVLSKSSERQRRKSILNLPSRNATVKLVKRNPREVILEKVSATICPFSGMAR